MSQRAIREFDAKHMRYNHIQQEYKGILINNEEIYTSFIGSPSTYIHTNQEYSVIKPDQLFGKRGLHGLIGVKLDPQGVATRLKDYRQKQQHIDGTQGTLDTFLIEPFIPHDKEWYIAIKTERDADILYFSDQGGVEVEENRDHIKEIAISVGETVTQASIQKHLGELPQQIITFIKQFFEFFKLYGFSYLEVNPFVLIEDKIICLDMVARVDTCEAWKQRKTRDHVSWVKAFGSAMHPLETEIERMDAETGASLKFSTLNPDGRIGLLLGGGGPSIGIIDKFSDMGLLDQVINYGELSGNPNYRHNKLYIQGIVNILVENAQKNPDTPHRLCYLGGISNFTKIDVICKAMVDALEEKVEEIKAAKIRIFVRRGGINDKKGLALVKNFCEKHDIRCKVADGDIYLTKAIKEIE